LFSFDFWGKFCFRHPVLLLCVEVLKLLICVYSALQLNARLISETVEPRIESFTFPHSNSVLFARKYPESWVCPQIVGSRTVFGCCCCWNLKNPAACSF
jgi:hypothetical protein